MTKPIPTLSRRLFLACASWLPLSACASDLIGPPEAGALYPVRPAFPAQNGAKVAWALNILRPEVGSGLDSDRIALLQPDGSMDFYAKATYPAPLPQIVQQTLLDAFEASGRIDAVALEQAALKADYTLATDVKDFAAHYAQRDGVPSVTVAITAKLATARGRVIVANFSTTQTGTAAANSAAAAAQALQQALGKAVSQIVAWALTAPMPVTQQPASTGVSTRPAEQLLHDVTRSSDRLR
ncbi:MAG TPA: ABC-type transport auxiliary lipoprotein family protein [Rhizomicrobium sp.]|nr:ABC-type transport auxiliary lipoprotein family protein [Rhizomicrobium sp.]